MGIVVFNYATWAAAYPQLAAFTTEPVATNYFKISTTLCDNSECALVPYDPPANDTRETALYLLVAHMATLADPARGGIVGRISSATQGSVSVSSELNVSDRQAWYAQTQWGLLYWNMTALYRTFRYIPGRQPFRQPRPPGAV